MYVKLSLSYPALLLCSHTFTCNVSWSAFLLISVLSEQFKPISILFYYPLQLWSNTILSTNNQPTRFMDVWSPFLGNSFHWPLYSNFLLCICVSSVPKIVCVCVWGGGRKGIFVSNPTKVIFGKWKAIPFAFVGKIVKNVLIAGELDSTFPTGGTKSQLTYESTFPPMQTYILTLMTAEAP